MLRNGADDSLIEEKMREAVFFKPDGHEFGRSGKGEEIETKRCLRSAVDRKKKSEQKIRAIR